ncbi:hypothetical protein QTP88_029709 [Uroleucon formosanum]
MHQGFRWVEVQGLRVYSCYWSPNCSIDEYKDFLLRLELSIRNSLIPVVVAGDFNAKSRAWGSPREDPRGTLLADMLASLDAAVCNNGQSPTFVRGQSQSYIDLTFVSARILDSVSNWVVREDESLSLHRYITFDVGSSSAATIPTSRGWATGKIEATQLKATLTRLADPQPETAAASAVADSLVEWMTQAADSCLPKRQQGNGRSPVPWWSDHIGSLRKECLRARRQFQRKRSWLGEDRSREYEEIWKGKRKQLALAIKEAKEKCWSDLIATVDKDPWGKPYKIVMKRLRRQRPIPGIQLPGRVDNIVDALFPTLPSRTPSTVHRTGVEPPEPFSMAELTTAARSLPNGKAPGPDGYDLLRIALPDEVELIAFADDVAVISTACAPFLLEERLEEAYNVVSCWMLDHGLSLAADKTEAIVFTKRRVRNQMIVTCDGHRISSKPSVRYLGLQVDQKLGFADHADMASIKAASASRSLGHLMPNLRGPRQKTRKLLALVTTSRILYAAPVWSESMLCKGWKKLESVHRRSQLRAACCYSTVSHEAAAVVSGIPPIRLLAKERTEVFEGKGKSEARIDLITNWQREWENCTNGRWTFRLINDLPRWQLRTFGEVCFHSSQVLTGHGCFAAYLCRFGIQATYSCEQCGFQPDDAEHAFFNCDEWENWRRRVCAEVDVEELTPENLMNTMLASSSNWNQISKLMSRIMTAREEAERIRQGHPT